MFGNNSSEAAPSFANAHTAAKISNHLKIK